MSSDLKMPFGKHKGTLVKDLPGDYLRWLGTIELRNPLLSEVKKALAWEPVPYTDAQRCRNTPSGRTLQEGAPGRSLARATAFLRVSQRPEEAKPRRQWLPRRRMRTSARTIPTRQPTGLDFDNERIPISERRQAGFRSYLRPKSCDWSEAIRAGLAAYGIKSHQSVTVIATPKGQTVGKYLNFNGRRLNGEAEIQHPRRTQMMPVQQTLVDPFGPGTAQLRTAAGCLLDGVVIRSSTALRRRVYPSAGTVIGRKHQNLVCPLRGIQAEGKNIELVP